MHNDMSATEKGDAKIRSKIFDSNTMYFWSKIFFESLKKQKFRWTDGKEKENWSNGRMKIFENSNVLSARKIWILFEILDLIFLFLDILLDKTDYGFTTRGKLLFFLYFCASFYGFFIV